MRLADLIDGAIAPLAPAWAARRMAARARLDAAGIALDAVRKYDAAGYDRRTSGWDRTASSADAESARGRQLLAWAAHDLARNNKYAAAGIGQMVSLAWGDGIAPQAIHPVKRIQQRAQDEIDRFAEGRVDDLVDWYAHGKTSVREMMVGGESIEIWRPDGEGPDGRVSGLEGAQLDGSKTYRLTGGGKIVQGVQFDGAGERIGYWLFEDHPNDVILGSNLTSRPVPAPHVDHLFERLRHRQTRGVSWLGPVAMTLRDIADIEDAKRLQAKVQACLALLISPGEGQDVSWLGQQDTPPGEEADNAKPLGETIRPGMIARLRAGETATIVNPTPSADNVEMIRQQLAAVSANMAPYHLMTGDARQATYTALRAVMNGAHSRVSDWQQNTIIPLLCRPMAERRMRRLAMQAGDARFLAVRWGWALPARYVVDPIKDLMGEIMEIRAGLKTLKRGLAERGINEEDHLAEIGRMNAIIDQLKLVLETDPRALTKSGILQAGFEMAAGKTNQGD